MADLALSHYSENRILIPKSKRQALSADSKPTGLWVSVDGEDDWVEWYKNERGEGCELEWLNKSFQYRHIIEIVESANILVLSRAYELDDFHRHYKKFYPFGDTGYGKNYIFWQQVAEDYDGIIIAPYQWQNRLMTQISDWYYPWDCASGCVWNAEAIRVVDTVRYKVDADA